MQYNTQNTLRFITQRRAIRVFDPAPIPADTRDRLLDTARLAPSSFNSQPYQLIWIESPQQRNEAARLCMGQSAAVTAAVLVVVVADIGSWQATADAHVDWMRREGFSAEKVRSEARRAKLVKWFFIQGWCNVLGLLKSMILRVVHLWKVIGTAPSTREGLFKWATKNAALASENLMIAAEALELNTCPMEGFDGRRLCLLLALDSRYHEIIMVIAVGKKSAEHIDQPQWRMPREATVRIL
jgi:nitroreductase